MKVIWVNLFYFVLINLKSWATDAYHFFVILNLLRIHPSCMWIFPLFRKCCVHDVILHLYRGHIYSLFLLCLLEWFHGIIRTLLQRWQKAHWLHLGLQEIKSTGRKKKHIWEEFESRRADVRTGGESSCSCDIKKPLYNTIIPYWTDKRFQAKLQAFPVRLFLSSA